jgi:hypothetical protein
MKQDLAKDRCVPNSDVQIVLQLWIAKLSPHAIFTINTCVICYVDILVF